MGAEYINVEILADPEIMVTVQMTCYNHEKYVACAIESILCQKTEFPFCILVHDDCSTDRSASIIRAYADAYPSKVAAIIQCENQFSQGIQITSTYLNPITVSPYVAYCESDDFWINTSKIQQQIEILEAHPECAATMGNCFCINESGVIFVHEPMRPQAECVYGLNDYIFSNRMPGQTASRMIRRSLIPAEEKELYDYIHLKANGDVKFDLLGVLNGGIYHQAEYFSVYRKIEVEGDSWTARNHDKNLCAVNYRAKAELAKFAQQYYGTDIKPEPHMLKQLVIALKRNALRGRDEDAAVLEDIRDYEGRPVLLIILRLCWRSISFVVYRIGQRLRITATPINHDIPFDVSDFERMLVEARKTNQSLVV